MNKCCFTIQKMGLNKLIETCITPYLLFKTRIDIQGGIAKMLNFKTIEEYVTLHTI